MNVILEALIATLILIGAFFLFVGSFALAKLPDLMRRLHGPTKATTLGIGALLVASTLYFTFVQGNLSVHEALITLFLFLTAPVTGQMIAKAFILQETQAGRLRLPETGRPVGWATIHPSDGNTHTTVPESDVPAEDAGRQESIRAQ
jgi:multicomponent K+:H+ antiporter subunit G